MNTEEEARVKISGRQGVGHGDDKRGVEPAPDRDLPRCSVEILRDLGLSKEKIIAYHRRFPTPTPTTGRGPRQREGVPLLSPSSIGCRVTCIFHQRPDGAQDAVSGRRSRPRRRAVLAAPVRRPRREGARGYLPANEGNSRRRQGPRAGSRQPLVWPTPAPSPTPPLGPRRAHTPP